MSTMFLFIALTFVVESAYQRRKRRRLYVPGPGAALWPGLSVGCNSLPVAVAMVRRALVDCNH